MKKSELAEVLRHCLPSKRMLDVVDFGMVNINGDIIILKERYGAVADEVIR